MKTSKKMQRKRFETRTVVMNIIEENIVSGQEVIDETKIVDIADSLEVVEIKLDLEDEFGLGEIDIDNIVTINDLVVHIEKMVENNKGK